MSRDPASIIRAALALANGTAIGGQRDAAVNRALFLIDKHRLNPLDFDIPGQEKPAPVSGFDFADMEAELAAAPDWLDAFKDYVQRNSQA